MQIKICWSPGDKIYLFWKGCIRLFSVDFELKIQIQFEVFLL
jgi:hypothetical protein